MMPSNDDNIQLGELAGLLNELVALQVMVLRDKFDNVSEYIVALSNVGFTNTRIAELLDAPPGTVRGAISKAKKRDD